MALKKAGVQPPYAKMGPVPHPPATKTRLSPYKKSSFAGRPVGRLGGDAKAIPGGTKGQ